SVIDNLLKLDTNPSLLHTIWWTLGLWGMIAFSRLLNLIYLVYWRDVITHRIYVRVYEQMTRKVMELSIRFHQDKKVGETMRKIERGGDASFDFLIDIFSRDLPNIIGLLAVIPIMLIINIKMGLIMTLVIPISLALTIYVGQKTHKKQLSIEQNWSKLSGISHDVIGNFLVVKSFNLVEEKLKSIHNTLQETHRVQVKILKWWSALIISSSFVSMMMVMTIFFTGTFLYSRGEMTIGEIVMFLGFAMMALSQAESLVNRLHSLLWKKEKLKEMFEVYDQVPEVQDCSQAIKLPKVQGKVEFKEVYFAYNPGKDVLHGVSFQVKPGETIALVGHTGSGKSTTVSLLSRFFDLRAGEILIDGQNIAQVTQNSLRDNIGMVFQDNLLFHDTIENNLRIGNPEVSEEDLIQACKDAEAWDFIQSTPHQLQTVVGERGVKFTGGEKQRLAIARALIKNPPILILDEATSALDAETEHKIQIAIGRLIQDRTTFIVAHRLNTIKKADRILVFEEGRIVEQGNFEELMAKQEHFYRLVQAQVEGLSKLARV
nr:ATP-binding cassette domain-containing protein [Candidatus Gracilibacteria bacterium]